MAAGRHGGYRDNEFRDCDSDLEASRRKDYYSDRERGRSEDLRSRVRVRSRDIKEREVNGSYRSPLSNSSGGSGNSHKRNHLSVKSADREPGELSSGEEDSRVRSTDGILKKEEKKRKFSPIVWDRDDNKQPSVVSLRSKNGLVDGVGLPPPPPLPRGFVPSSSVDANVSIDSPNDRELGMVEEEAEEEGFRSARHISSSRWADSDEGEESDAVIFPKKRKNTPLTDKKPPSPELGEVVMREGSEGANSKSSESGRENREGSDRENEVDKNDYMDVDEEEGNGDDRSDRILDTDSEDGDERGKTPEPANPPQRTINMLQGCRSVDEFERLNKIDEGTYGVVYRAKDKKTGEVVALKKVKMEKEREGFPLTSLREINILLSFHHPSIVDVKEVVVGSSLDSIFMVMEYMEHDLKALMETMKQPFSQSEVKCLMLQLFSGVKYLHDNWVLHRYTDFGNVGHLRHHLILVHNFTFLVELCEMRVSSV